MQQSCQQQQQPPPSTSAPPLLPQSEFGTLTLEHTLEDLCARFIVNLPAEELASMDRVCFQIEQAHWYYEDFVRPSAINPSLLPSFGLRHFSLLMFRSCPLLHDLVSKHDAIWMSFMAYKERVPVCGAILISEFWDKVLLVKGWQKSASWSFPRGKINKEEPEGMCAIREVLEETGYDLSSHFPQKPGHEEWEGAERKPYYVELVIKEQKIRLYFIPGVHEDTYFETRTRKEISKIDWFKLSDLPTWSRDKKGNKSAQGLPGKGQRFYMVTPFISHLKLWIDRNKPKNLRQRSNIPKQQQQPQQQRPPPPTPHAAYAHDGIPRELPPHLQQDADTEYYNPPAVESDDFAQSTSPSFGSTEEDEVSTDDSDDGVRRPATFETKEEGTEALNALFFGGGPALSNGSSSAVAGYRSESTERPLNASLALSTSLADLTFDEPAGSARTPPQLAYERQQSFVQPRPKATSRHTTGIIALLENDNPVASPPPAKPRRRKAKGGPREGGSLLSTFDQLLTSAPTATFPPPHAPSRQTSSPAQSILFADSDPPPEAEGFGLTHVLTDVERGETERREKHFALLRALEGVPTPPPMQTPAVPDNIRTLFKGPRRPESPSFVADLDANGWPVSSPGISIELGEPFEEEERTRRSWSPEGTAEEERRRWSPGVGTRVEGHLEPAWRGEYGGPEAKLPFPGESSPLPLATDLRTHRDRSFGLSPPLSPRREASEHDSPGREAAPTSVRAQASASLLTILNGTEGSKPVPLERRASFVERRPSFGQQEERRPSFREEGGQRSRSPEWATPSTQQPERSMPYPPPPPIPQANYYPPQPFPSQQHQQQPFLPPQQQPFPSQFALPPMYPGFDPRFQQPFPPQHQQPFQPYPSPPFGQQQPFSQPPPNQQHFAHSPSTFQPPQPFAPPFGYAPFPQTNGAPFPPTNGAPFPPPNGAGGPPRQEQQAFQPFSPLQQAQQRQQGFGAGGEGVGQASQLLDLFNAKPPMGTTGRVR